jgi:putative hemolysin
MLIATEAAQAGVLTQRERSLILNSLSLGKKTAEQIMVPRVRAAYVDIRRSMDENLVVVERNLFSRLPLTNGDMDHVIGVVYTKDFLTAYRSGGESSLLPLIAEPAVFAPTMVRLDQLLQTFHEHRTRMVFLVDEHGGVEGIVTLTDVFDELLALLQPPTPGDETSDFR